LAPPNCKEADGKTGADGTCFFQLIELFNAHAATSDYLVHFQEMSPQPSVTEIRLNNGVTYLTLAASTLKDFSDLFSTPFLKTISNTIVSLLQSVQVRPHSISFLFYCGSISISTEYQKKSGPMCHIA
jgi:hypothetical protein